MNRFSPWLLVVLLATGCGEGIPTRLLLEPIPALETCEFDNSIFSQRETYTDSEWGQVVDGAFVPFAGGEEVEMRPVPRETMRWWFAFVAVRIKPTEALGAELCARLDQSVIFGPDPNADTVPEGLLFHRQSDGTYLNAQVPLFLGTRRATESGFDPLDPRPVTLHSETGFAPGKSGPLRLYGPRVDVQPVNHAGFLSTPRPTPDAGSMEVWLALTAQASKTLLSPGETANVELRLNGARRGNDVSLAVQGLPQGVTLTLERTTIPGSLPDADAELTRGVLEVTAGATPGPFTLTFTASAGGASTSTLLGLEVFQGPTTRMVTVSASPASLMLAPGAEQPVRVRLAPFGGFTGKVFLKALAPPELALTFEPESVQLTSATDVTVRVKLLQASFPNDTTGFQLFAVSGRERWAPSQFVSITSLAPAAPVPFVVSPVRERRFVTPNVAFDWAFDVGASVGIGQQPPAVTLSTVVAPMNCGSGIVGGRVRLVCDSTFSGAGEVTVTASSSAGNATTAVRVVSAGAATLMPEVQPFLWDSQRPEVAVAPGGALGVLQQTGLGHQFTTIAADGGVSTYQPETGRLAALASTPTGVVRVTVIDRRLTATGKYQARDDVLGPIAAAADVDGTVWVAVGALVNAQAHPSISVSAPGDMNWTTRDTGLASAGVTTDLALAVRSGTAVLASVEGNAVVVRSFSSGTWSALPAVPNAAVLPAAFEGRGSERALGVAMDGANRPVVAFLGADEQVHVVRLEGTSWVALGGATVSAGLLPLSLSLAVDPSGRVLLAWHEATHPYVANSGARIVPRHVETSALRWARLESGTTFTALPAAGLDVMQGAPQQPHVSVDATGRPVLAWVEDGRVLVLRGPP